VDQWRTVTQRLARSIPELSPRLRKVARHVLEHPGDVATLSMRKLSKAAGVPPATTARLPRALGFGSWEEFREVFRDNVRASPYRRRAAALQQGSKAQSAQLLWEGMREAMLQNLEQLFDAIDAEEIAATTKQLASARRVHVVGMQSSGFFASYLHYVAQMARPGWHLIDGAGGDLADDAIRVSHGDALVAIAFATYARGTVEVARYAHDRGATIIAITDTLNSPLVPLATRTLLVSARSPHFFESYVAAAALIEMIVAQLVSRSGKTALRRIEELEQVRRNLGVYWKGSD